MVEGALLETVMTEISHLPVMAKEVIDFLKLAPGRIIVDGTLGMGGHSRLILERIIPGGKLIGIDRDAESISQAQESLKNFSGNFQLLHGSFSDIDTLLRDAQIEKVDGIVLDLGISSYQLGNPERGFSFTNEGPLDMRLDRSSYISAYDLVNNLNEEEISSLLWHFGEERFANRIARTLVRERAKHPISTTRELSEIVLKALPYKHRFHRTHPATRTFQAVRIAVNRELENLESALQKSALLLNKGGRLCVISFHSLEDRIVKHTFRRFASDGLFEILTPKPLSPKEDELNYNPSSRSAKLRVVERF